jgi:hypothetical protein
VGRVSVTAMGGRRAVGDVMGSLCRAQAVSRLETSRGIYNTRNVLNVHNGAPFGHNVHHE